MGKDDSIHQIKLSIKQWEHEFQQKHNHLPTKTDIKSLPEIHKLYQAYRDAKKKATVPHDSRSKKVEEKKAEGVKHIDIKITESLSDEEEANQFKNTPGDSLSLNAELGPTPQANGKILSIFDISLTPPESSPLKPKIALPELSRSPLKPKSENFKTPTKSGVKRLQFLDLTPSKKQTPVKGLTSKLHSIANESSPIATPKSTIEPTNLETPSYLSKNNRKFDFTHKEEKSPVPAVTIKSSPFASNANPSTPSKSSLINFSVSPSPLKPHRFMSFGVGKKLSDIYNEYKHIQMEDIDENEVVEEQEQLELEETSADQPRPKKKALTQKRTTRRWKIKPRNDNTGEDSFLNKNIHEEIKKLDEQNLKQYIDYIDENEVSEEELNSDEEIELQLKKRPVEGPGKSKPISNNYQRLKINDPRSKRFKSRMRKR